MRKTVMICLLVLVGSLASYGQSQPQWVIVYSVSLYNQTRGIPFTTAFTPTANAIYRISGCLEGSVQSNPAAVVYWARGDGNEATDFTMQAGGNYSFVFMPKVGIPVRYFVSANGGYSVAFTIEQLQTGN
jgi:hypothetical protein